MLIVFVDIWINFSHKTLQNRKIQTPEIRKVSTRFDNWKQIYWLVIWAEVLVMIQEITLLTKHRIWNFLKKPPPPPFTHPKAVIDTYTQISIFTFGNFYLNSQSSNCFQNGWFEVRVTSPSPATPPTIKVHTHVGPFDNYRTDNS